MISAKKYKEYLEQNSIVLKESQHSHFVCWGCRKTLVKEDSKYTVGRFGEGKGSYLYLVFCDGCWRGMAGDIFDVADQ